MVVTPRRLELLEHHPAAMELLLQLFMLVAGAVLVQIHLESLQVKQQELKQQDLVLAVVVVIMPALLQTADQDYLVLAVAVVVVQRVAGAVQAVVEVQAAAAMVAGI